MLLALNTPNEYFLVAQNAKTLTNTFRLAWVCKDNLNRYSQDL